MAKIKEFSGYRYDPLKCGVIEDVIAPPYDVVTESEREEFQKKNEYNIVRVSNTISLENDDDENNKYTRANDFLSGLIEKEIIKKEDKPVMYLYEQHSIYKKTVFVNHGIIALLKLEELEKNAKIKVCEETKTDFMEDRYNLLKHTKANIDMISCMYIDYERPLTHLLNEIADEEPQMEFNTKESITGEITRNRLWVIKDDERIDFIKKNLYHTNFYITDGHNRYKAALKYREECMKKNPNHTGEEAYNYILAFMNNAYGDNLVQIPVHRILNTKKKFSEDYFITCVQDHFKVEKIIVDVSNDDLVDTMKKQIETSRRKNIIGIYCGGNYFYRLTLTDTEYMNTVLPERSKEYRMLDVTVLNELLLKELLNIDKDNYEEFIKYTKRTTTGVEMVNNKEASCMFVMNITKAEHICEVVESGETMPEKSIYLFPKTVTGVVINKISENQ